jgi:hypothetical protein
MVPYNQYHGVIDQLFPYLFQFFLFILLKSKIWSPCIVTGTVPYTTATFCQHVELLQPIASCWITLHKPPFVYNKKLIYPCLFIHLYT